MLNFRSINHLVIKVAALWCLSAGISVAASIVVIEGVEGELAENIRALVAQPPVEDNERKFKRYINGLPEQAISAMSALGYYAAQAQVSVDQVLESSTKSAASKTVESIKNTVRKNKDDDGEPASERTVKRITINVVPNDPVLITSLELQIEADSEHATDFDETESAARDVLATGNVFVSSDYESAKSSFLDTAQQLGYFDFQFTTNQVKVSRRKNTATIVLTAISGQRYTFGQSIFKQRTFSRAFMESWVPFAEGEPYQAEKIGELTDSLQGSGYFSSVRVRPIVDPRYGKTVPVSVDLTQSDRNNVAVGVGFSTDTNFRTKLTWGKPLLNSRGHSAEVGTQLSSDQQSASFEYRIPRSNDPLFNYWGLEFGLKNDREGDFDTFLSTLNFQRVRRTKRGWTESLFVRWERETFDISDEEQTTDLVLPGFNYSRSSSEGTPFATRGQSVSVRLMAGSRDVLSTINFLKAVGRFRFLRAISARNTFIGTLQLGAYTSDDFDRVPTTQRFFAGGDRTVRGYSFRDISPLDDEGEAIGGRYLEVYNLEYNYRFADLWSAAIFADTGRAFDEFDDRYRLGAGLGVRWQSPVGAFRIDIAQPINDDDVDGFRIHLSLGPDF